MVRAPLAIIALLIGLSAPAQDIAHSDVSEWLSNYEAAWENRDADAAARLFSDDARYFETPWSEPFEGRGGIAEYWQGVTADQRNVDFEYTIVALDGATAVARWSARFEVAGADAQVALDGVFILEFTDAGTVSELREWWVLQP